MAVIQFDLDGHIVDANQNFLCLMDYRLDDVLSQHHRMFMTLTDRGSDSYRQFWEALHRGDFNARRFCCLDKHGREVWINASYNPLLDRSGRTYRVAKRAPCHRAKLEDRHHPVDRVDLPLKIGGLAHLRGDVGSSMPTRNFCR